MKKYKGERHTGEVEFRGQKINQEKIEVTVCEYDVKKLSHHYSEFKFINSKPLKHHILHSPTGFEWGYAGSGPADLAYSILWDFLGCEPEQITCMKFKDRFVNNWERERWQISEDDITGWYVRELFYKRIKDQRKS